MPDERPELKLLSCSPGRRSDGVVLLTVGRATRAIHRTSDYEAVIAIDRTGRIVWQRRFDFCLMDIRRSRRDTLLVMGTGGLAAEIDTAGTLLHEWYCRGLHPDRTDGIPVDTMKFHHSICEIEGGHLCSLSIERRPLAQPDAEADHMMLDTIVIWDRDGTVVEEMSLSEVCDVERFGHDFAPVYYANQGWPRTRDWSHGNCIVQDPRDDGFLISFRHQDCIAKVSRRGAPVWIMGTDRGYRPQFRSRLLTMDWQRPFYHQHDISIVSNGDLMLFDNGAAGAFPPEPRQPLDEQESHAVCFRVDERSMTATETWRYGGEGRLPFSLYVGGVCEMPNGNRFIACTGLKHDKAGNRVAMPPEGVGAIELVEVTPDGERVFHARIEAPGDPVGKGWSGFRPEYLAPDMANRLTA